MKYRFITNFKEERLTIIYAALKACDINDYCFCKIAKNKHGEVILGYFALYFKEHVTEKDEELFYRALLFIDFHTK